MSEYGGRAHINVGSNQQHMTLYSKLMSIICDFVNGNALYTCLVIMSKKEEPPRFLVNCDFAHAFQESISYITIKTRYILQTS